MVQLRASIIIPAHNEQAVIARCLRAMINGISDGTLEVTVVCNGCIDQTAEVARALHPNIKCIVLEDASKALALRSGDQAATAFPRFYIDADVIVDCDSILGMCEAIECRGYLAVSPMPKVDLSRANWGVRAFYRVWERLPYYRRGMIGSGVYGLSAIGRARFQEFPDINTDDRFVRALFTESERALVENSTSIVSAPANLRSLFKVKSRSAIGGYQFAKMFPELMSNEKKEYGSVIADWFVQPWFWPYVAVYILVTTGSRALAFLKIKMGRTGGWARDETTRHL